MMTQYLYQVMLLEDDAYIHINSLRQVVAEVGRMSWLGHRQVLGIGLGLGWVPFDYWSESMYLLQIYICHLLYGQSYWIFRETRTHLILSLCFRCKANNSLLLLYRSLQLISQSTYIVVNSLLLIFDPLVSLIKFFYFLLPKTVVSLQVASPQALLSSLL